jgi:uracil-DNA glycosylase family 4
MHPRILARQFAATLAELRESWDVHYWPGGAMPRDALPSDAPTSPHADPLTDAESLADAVASPRAAEPAAPVPAAPAPSTTHLPVASEVRAQAKQWTPATKLEYLRTRNIGDCQRCGLSRTRTNIVFGVGNPEAQIMFVGEAPGADEDRQGEPFVGRAGARLNVWLGALGLARTDVYIANVLKCRPPGNRDPKPDEVDRCSPFLQAQIRAIAPRVIIALGRHAGMLLSRREDLTLKAMRSASLCYDVELGAGETRRIPIVVTYHPAYVLRQEGTEGGVEATERLVMADLRRAIELTRE